VVMGIVQYLVAVGGVWNIAAFSGSLAGMAVAYPIARRYRGEQQDNGELDGRALLVALSGYAILVAVILAVQLIPALNDFLDRWSSR